MPLRAAEVVPLPDRIPTLADAVEAFFADKDLSPNSVRTYRQALDALVADLGQNMAISHLTGSHIRAVLTGHWGNAAPATWNARLTAIQSLVRYCRRNQWLTDPTPLAAIDRKRVPHDQTKAIPYDDLQALWTRPDIALRERTLWRMLYETAARTNEILALNIEHLNRPRKRAAVVGKGGHREIVVWASGTARLLPRYLAGRRRGPVFVTNRRPNQVPAGPDQCPDTGLGRLSYGRAWSAFKTASQGWTLHQLRHSALTHLGEKGVSAVLLQAKSRHQDPRTLARYAKPGIEAVAALTAQHDPGRRYPQ